MENKRVVFVEPKGAPFNVFNKSMNIPLLGTVYLATKAEQSGYDGVSIINENILGRKINPEELESADILGLSCITATVNRGKEIAEKYKRIRQDAGLESKVIIGGIHASMMPDDVVSHFDQVIVGEAEEIILDILSGKIKDEIVYAPRPDKLDELPLLNFKLIKDWEKINKPILPIMTSRGCPYNCDFCSVTEMFGRKYRTQSPERVIDELLRYKEEYKKGRIFFSDDNFAADIKRTEDILDMMIEHGFDMPWSAQVRTEITKNTKFVAKMEKAGCTTVCVGLESINPQSLEEMNKNQTVEDIVRSIDVFHDKDIDVHGMFIFGNDSDTKDIFEMTSDFSRKTALDYVQFSILTPLPGTKTYFRLKKEKRLLHENWDYYDGLHVVFKPKNITPDELQQGTIKCFKKFYSYSRAIEKFLDTFVDSVITPIKKTYTNAHFPSLKPAVMRLAGRKIVKNWINHNKKYLGYLRRISVPKLKRV